MSTPAPTAPATPPRAATVLVLRAAAPAASPADEVGEVAEAADAGAVEVLLVRRSHRASFMANAFVFPGGRVDAADAVGEPAEPGAAADPLSPPLYPARRAAARELAEEVGLRVGDLGQLVRFAHWITPSAEPKRFDTEFFLWSLPSPRPAGTVPGAGPSDPAQLEPTVQVDGREVFDPLWITPAAALDRYAQGTLNLPPPTVCTLEDLAAEIAAARSTPVAATAAASAGPSAALLSALMTRCAARQPLPVLPKFFANDAGELAIVMPWDPQYPELPGEGQPFPALARGAARVPRRIRRCQLRLEGAAAPLVPWTVERTDF